MKIRSAAVLFTTILIAGLFAAPACKATEEPKTASILLASESTRFKDALIEEMEALFKASGFKVVKADHSRDTWREIKASDYDAVFITNSGVNSKVRPWVQEWLSRNAGSAAVILLHTTQTSNWKVIANVDSVTSASEVKNVKGLAADYHRRITEAIKARTETVPAPQ